MNARSLLYPLFAAMCIGSFGITASAWTGPTSTPPNANADAPLNVGSTSQTKLGSMGAYGLFLTGTAPQYINFSSTLGSTGFGIRNNSGSLEYKHSGGSWTAMSSSLWTASGANMYFSTGDVAIGNTSPGEKIHISGNVLQDNSNTLRSKNTSGTVETWMWPRYSDNGTYMNYGSAGLFLRNNSSTTTMTLTASNRVGIGETNPSTQLHTTGGVRFATFGAGTLSTDASGNLTVSSDERLKTRMSPYTSGSSAILNLHPIRYHWSDASGFDTKHEYVGFSAQDVEMVLPEAVSTDSRGYKTLSDRALIAALINTVQEQEKRLRELERTCSVNER